MILDFFSILRDITVGGFVNQRMKKMPKVRETSMERVVIFLVFAVYMYMYIDDLTLYMNAHVETRG